MKTIHMKQVLSISSNFAVKIKSKYLCIPFHLGETLVSFLSSSRFLKTFLALPDGIEDFKNGGHLQISIACNLFPGLQSECGVPHSDSAVSHLMPSKGETKAILSLSATDGLFQKSKMLGNKFQVHVLSCFRPC